MARLTAPLLSLRASGAIGDAIVFASWKGIPYARTYVIPENPNTLAQQEVRGVFSTLSELWKRMPVEARRPFTLAVRGLPLTDRNKHVQVNVAALIDQADLDLLVMSVASGNAIPPVNVIPADGGGQTISWTADAPASPPGYTLAVVYGVAVEDGDPSPVLTRTTFAGQVVAGPWAGSVDVETAGDFQFGLFALWLRDADDRQFISAAVRSQVVVA